ncbi:MAG: lysylphosphatidylglycerol synthase transmembrane domain-containing protein [Actinomycetota bacterium]
MTSRRALQRAAAIAVVLAAFAFVLPRLADYGEVWREVKTLDARSLTLLAGVTVINLATFAPPWMAALPGLGFWRAFVATQASTASTYVAPGGAAVGIAASLVLLRKWGYRTSDAALAAALTGIWNQLTLLGFPALALGLLTLTGGQNPLLRTVGLLALVGFAVGLVVFACALVSNRLARRVGTLAWRGARRLARVARRGEIRWDAETIVQFRRRTAQLLARRWHVLTVATLVGQLSVFAVLLTCLRTLGVTGGEVSLVEAFAAWSLVRLLGSLPLTPGGIGIVEVGLTGLLVGFGGSHAEVVAAVLLYRFLTIVPTLALGVALGATWRPRGATPAG